MDEKVQARIGHNEALFRVTNEEVTDLAGRAKTFEIVCECGYSNCRKMITVTPEAYERVRSHSDRFIVRADHQIEEVETVVDVVDSGWELGSYFVVEKGEGVPRQVAEETDPRAR
jgi:hypothetical protein